MHPKTEMTKKSFFLASNVLSGVKMEVYIFFKDFFESLPISMRNESQRSSQRTIFGAFCPHSAFPPKSSRIWFSKFLRAPTANWNWGKWYPDLSHASTMQKYQQLKLTWIKNGFNKHWISNLVKLLTFIQVKKKMVFLVVYSKLKSWSKANNVFFLETLRFLWPATSE